MINGAAAPPREIQQLVIASHRSAWQVLRFGELRLVRALSDEQIGAMRDPKLAATVKLPTIEDAVKAGGFLAGTPADIIEQLKAVAKR